MSFILMVQKAVSVSVRQRAVEGVRRRDDIADPAIDFSLGWGDSECPKCGAQKPEDCPGVSRVLLTLDCWDGEHG